MSGTSPADVATMALSGFIGPASPYSLRAGGMSGASTIGPWVSATGLP